ncbi:MAG: hypothetical protein M5U33_01630 [Pseudorhodoplanes sp.]|nr:hypothetical protein [Pseudorhodoplanes sp.]
MSRVRITRRALVASLVIAGVLSAPPLQSQTSRPARPPDPARIYLLRGLFGVFSHGIDQLAERLNAQGYSTVLLGWSDAQKVVSEIEAAHRAGDTSHIILIGHSLGSNAAGGIANVLDQKDIPVDLVVTFDVTDPMQASANVGRFINFFQFNGFGRPVTPGPDSRAICRMSICPATQASTTAISTNRRGCRRSCSSACSTSRTSMCRPPPRCERAGGPDPSGRRPACPPFLLRLP